MSNHLSDLNQWKDWSANQQIKIRIPKGKWNKTKRKNKIKEEFSTFDHTGILNISHNSGNISKSLWRDSRPKERCKNIVTQDAKSTKFDKEISKLWKIKSGGAKDSRNVKMDRLDIHNTYSIPNKIYTETVSAFGRKGSSISKNKNKDKLLLGANTFDNQVFNMIVNIDKNASGNLNKPKHDTKRSDGK